MLRPAQINDDVVEAGKKCTGACAALFVIDGGAKLVGVTCVGYGEWRRRLAASPGPRLPDDTA